MSWSWAWHSVALIQQPVSAAQSVVVHVGRTGSEPWGSASLEKWQKTLDPSKYRPAVPEYKLIGEKHAVFIQHFLKSYQSCHAQRNLFSGIRGHPVSDALIWSNRLLGSVYDLHKHTDTTVTLRDTPAGSWTQRWDRQPCWPPNFLPALSFSVTRTPSPGSLYFYFMALLERIGYVPVHLLRKETLFSAFHSACSFWSSPTSAKCTYTI